MGLEPLAAKILVMSDTRKAHATGPGYFAVELMGYYYLSKLWDIRPNRQLAI